MNGIIDDFERNYLGKLSSLLTLFWKRNRSRKSLRSAGCGSRAFRGSRISSMRLLGE